MIIEGGCDPIEHVVVKVARHAAVWECIFWECLTRELENGTLKDLRGVRNISLGLHAENIWDLIPLELMKESRKNKHI